MVSHQRQRISENGFSERAIVLVLVNCDQPRHGLLLAYLRPNDWTSQVDALARYTLFAWPRSSHLHTADPLRCRWFQGSYHHPPFRPSCNMPCIFALFSTRDSTSCRHGSMMPWMPVLIDINIPVLKIEVRYEGLLSRHSHAPVATATKDCSCSGLELLES